MTSLAEREVQSDVVELWECHEAAFNVFRRCEWNVAMGMRLVWIGINAVEIEKVASATGVPYNDELIDDVKAMAAVAASVRNAKNQ
jgi:hypothetical protein